ncbi:hypothetical protein AMTR_s00003p00265670 [Amborella trichopoda]|uniref:Uncharacterized protein n=1 Tax=Amborella trichopoda TaxID=13333 RepID=W1P8Y5_AMBTC|nr:hypothetical protein AMTR_s00003p00265670 [Amborella trichopoda]
MATKHPTIIPKTLSTKLPIFSAYRPTFSLFKSSLPSQIFPPSSLPATNLLNPKKPKKDITTQIPKSTTVDKGKSTQEHPPLQNQPSPSNQTPEVQHIENPIIDFLLRTIQSNHNDQEPETSDASSEHSADYLYDQNDSAPLQNFMVKNEDPPQQQEEQMPYVEETDLESDAGDMGEL